MTRGMRKRQLKLVDLEVHQHLGQLWQVLGVLLGDDCVGDDALAHALEVFDGAHDLIKRTLRTREPIVELGNVAVDRR